MREISNEPKYILPKCTHLWEFNVNEKTSLCEHSNECIDIKPLDTYDEMIYLLSYDVLILESNFHYVWVECKKTLY